MAEYSNPMGVIPRLIAAAHRWQQRGGREPADVGSLPLNRLPTAGERYQAEQTGINEAKSGSLNPIDIFADLFGGAAGPAKAMFMGAKALRAPKGRIDEALRLREAGVPERDIYFATQGPKGEPGISFGKEGDPRWEIEDFMGYAPGVRSQIASLLDTGKSLNTTLGALITDRELLANYPWLRDIAVSYTPKATGKATGTYLHHPKGWAESRIEIEGDPSLFQSYLAHEVQHPIQVHEGFARGGAMDVGTFLGSKGDPQQLAEYIHTPEGRRILYSRLAGEAEARNTQSRLNTDLLTRALLHPEETEDVPRKLQIIRR